MEPTPSLQPHRVLSLDGGPGMFVGTRVLRALAHQAPEMLERTTLFAGTSSGALCALFLARQMSEHNDPVRATEALVRFFDEAFVSTFPTLLDWVRATLGVYPLIPMARFQPILKKAYGEHTRLQDLSTSVCTLSFRMKQPLRIQVCNNFLNDGSETTTLTDAASYSSAFPIAVSTWEGHIDGGWYANNPSLVALSSLARKEHQDYIEEHDATFQEAPFYFLQNTKVLSLGADNKIFGSPSLQRRLFRHVATSWGWKTWLLNRSHPFLLMDTFLDANFHGTNKKVSILLGSNYQSLAYYGYTPGLTAAFLRILRQPPEKVSEQAERDVNLWVQGNPSSRPLFSQTFEELTQWVRDAWVPCEEQ
ncbi:MAG: hypothetical protein EP343_20735 [Deltaproteobacteria bacterium]|nr:MAG: hypothetical protein EP343_20735 [Deltaproteobacteria bacterium]